ncbi:6-bladed beta-propeller [Puteibacter caeruleilacunae]|nr:6-bladed beta-propeller [Puteibacter caeruleilacunae]
MKPIYLISLCVALITVACQQTKEPTIESTIINIDLTENIVEKSTPVNLSNVASEVEYIALENNSNCILLGSRIFVFDSLLVCPGFRQIYIFNRYTGKFVREVGEKGRGPQAYWNVNHYVHLDKDRGIIINTGGWTYSLIEFSPDGEIKGKVNLEKRASFATKLKGDLYAAYYRNFTGQEKERIVIWDNNEKNVVKRFKNYRTCENDPKQFTHLPYEGWFYYYNEELMFKEYFCDTVYKLSEEKMTPHIILNSGEYRPPYEERELFNSWEYHGLSYIMETNSYLFFKLNFDKKSYYCYYDKRRSELKISRPDEKNKKNAGLVNDIDGFVRFAPESITKDNEIVGHIEAYQLVKWMNDNPDKVANLPDHLKKFKDIKDADNPIVMIAKLKK